MMTDMIAYCGLQFPKFEILPSSATGVMLKTLCSVKCQARKTNTVSYPLYVQTLCPDVERDRIVA